VIFHKDSTSDCHGFAYNAPNVAVGCIWNFHKGVPLIYVWDG
jgi:hypothetical protein